MNTLTARFVEVEDAPLPASAQAAIYTVIGQYLDWLSLFDHELSDLIQIDWIDFHDRCCRDIPAYETLALSMWTAPYFGRFCAEQSYAAQRECEEQS